MNAHLLSGHCDFIRVTVDIFHLYYVYTLTFTCLSENLKWILEHFVYRSGVLYVIGYYIHCLICRGTVPPMCHLRHRLLQRCSHVRSRLLSRLQFYPCLLRPLRSQTRTVLHGTSCCGTLMSRAQVQTHLPPLLTYLHHFSHRLPRRSNIHSYRRTCHQLWGHARVQYRIPQGNTGNYVTQWLNINFCSGGVCTTSNRFLHHRHRRAVSSTWLCAVFCGERRSRRLNLTKTLHLKIWWRNFTITLKNQSLNSRKLLNIFTLIFLNSLYYFACVC